MIIFGSNDDKVSFACTAVPIDFDEDDVINSGAVLAFPDTVARRLWFEAEEHLKVRVELRCQDENDEENIGAVQVAQVYILLVLRNLVKCVTQV